MIKEIGHEEKKEIFEDWLQEICEKLRLNAISTDSSESKVTFEYIDKIDGKTKYQIIIKAIIGDKNE